MKIELVATNDTYTEYSNFSGSVKVFVNRDEVKVQTLKGTYDVQELADTPDVYMGPCGNYFVAITLATTAGGVIQYSKL